MCFPRFVVLASAGQVESQQAVNTYVDRPTVVTSQLGFRVQGPKTVTLLPSPRDSAFPGEIPFYVQVVGSRMKREQHLPKSWSGAFFDWPFDIDKGRFAALDRSGADATAYKGTLKRIDSRWGTFWQGDFTAFARPGLYQIETEFGFTTPFVIESNPYDRFVRGYLNYLYCQRSGIEIPGIRPLENADDGVLDMDGSYVPAAGGWNDAGDFRKWISQTSSHIEALCLIAKHADQSYHDAAMASLLSNAGFKPECRLSARQAGIRQVDITRSCAIPVASSSPLDPTPRAPSFLSLCIPPVHRTPMN